MLPFINAPFAYVADALGASTDELKLVASFLISYPLAGLLKRIPDSKPWQKNAFIISVSLFYLVGLFDLWAGLRTLFISSAGAYAIAKYIDGPLMPWIGFVFLMGHMSVNHLDRQFRNEPQNVDITGAQMVLIMKLTAFCWNVHDGRLPENELSDYQKERALRDLPSILDYVGYVLFFPSLFAGPAFDYVDYRQWLTTSMFELPPGVDPSKAAPTRKKRKIPRSGTPAAWKAAYGLVWIFAFLTFSGWYSTDLLLGDEYMKHNFLKRLYYLHMVGFAARMKYYGVWHLTEGACILSGIGYKGVDPKTGRVNWNRLQNVKPLGIEFAQNTHAYLGNWNINTNLWLRNYMYLRVTPKGKKPGFRASMATFVTSAFWHGFYPGYYMSFVLASFLQTIAKNGRRLLRPFFLAPDGQRPLPTKIYYDIFTWLVTQLAFSYTVIPFITLELAPSLLIWRRVYFFTIVGVIVSLAFLASPGKKMLQKKVAQRSGAAKPAAVKDTATSTATAQKPSVAELISRGRSSLTIDDLLEEKVLGEALGIRPGLSRNPSAEGAGRVPLMGLPEDPGLELDEAIEEVKAEIAKRKASGEGPPGPHEVRAWLEEKVKELKKRKD
ncbi:putative mboat family protein [Lasiodiplodia theobromae]|uniref:Lysophospholipid acyltransferase n=1 Tax=Lasiodiplodia theobromae TaxID=45133 RepID=A0A5N5DDR3_9PEZI|nr:Mboat family protein [Lasiodiplodia theobromae]KAB2575831.1 Lysophospholipid acyltransferase [Lasiodiplodia theobromae]KAF4546512.1 Mboat family protein [Lasiodiplodia theobromae]KAF9631923.1 putative mboat family protein [Lasiodiplodia theobromae]